MWDLIVSVPDHCLSSYLFTFPSKEATELQCCGTDYCEHKAVHILAVLKQYISKL